jgi:hypothetical protein
VPAVAWTTIISSDREEEQIDAGMVEVGPQHPHRSGDRLEQWFALAQPAGGRGRR